MVQGGSIDTVGCNALSSPDIWIQGHFASNFSQPPRLAPEIGAMQELSSQPLISNHSPEASNHTSSPPSLATSSNSSAFPSPGEPSYFMEPITPASLVSERVVPKPSHSKKRPPGHIPRPRNAFILFRSHYVAAQLIPGKVENDHRHISKIIGEIWNNLPPRQRLAWEQLAELEKEKHNQMYPGYRYKPVKLEGVVKRRVKCRSVPTTASPYSTAPGIGSANGPRELVGSLNVGEGGQLCFVDNEKAKFINQEERRKDKARCARVAELVQRGLVGDQLTKEAQRLGLDRESVAAPTPQLQPSANDPPGMRGHFHTNIEILRALDRPPPVFTDPFAPDNPEIPRQDRALEPHRRASSVPLGASSHIEPAAPRSAVSQAHQRETTLASSIPLRPLSSSPLSRHRRPCNAYPRKREAQADQANSDVSAVEHVGHHSPSNTPPEFYYDPSSYPKQIDRALEHPVAGSPTSQSSTTPGLYGIDPLHSRQGHEPIDLSVMYDHQDIAAGHGSALHSTYAITGKPFPSVPEVPAPLQVVHDSHPLSLACKPVHQPAPGSALGIGPEAAVPTYYHWQATYNSDSGYAQTSQYSPPPGAIPYDMQRVYFPTGAGDSTY